MSGITDLIGPNPDPAPVPQFPTPWTDDGPYVIDNRGSVVVSAEGNGDYNVTNRVAMFIAEAVNEKIARDSASATEAEYRYFHDGDEKGRRYYLRVPAGREVSTAELGRDYSYRDFPVAWDNRSSVRHLTLEELTLNWVEVTYVDLPDQLK